MKDKKQIQRMLWVSIGLHVSVICLMILTYFITPEIEVVSSPSSDAQFVELVEMADLPDLPKPKPEPQREAPKEQDLLAFRTISTIIHQPTPTPTPPPTPTPRILPTSTPRPTPSPTPLVIVTTPTPVPTRKPLPTPRPQRQPRLSPSYQPTPTPPEEMIVVEVPRREPVIQYTPHPQEELSSAREGQQVSSQQTPSQGTGRGNGSQTGRPGTGLSNGPSVTLDQTDAFPYPEYLAYIEEKIAGLWFPQGAGTVSIYLIIAGNGKILKSGVDKGEGVGVQKLRDSIIRAIGMIKRFEPLPQNYQGTVLRVRIMVRR